MKKVLKIVSFLGLAILLISPLLEIAGKLTAENSKWGLAAGTLLWFATAPFWMQSKNDN